MSDAHSSFPEIKPDSKFVKVGIFYFVDDQRVVVHGEPHDFIPAVRQVYTMGIHCGFVEDPNRCDVCNGIHKDSPIHWVHKVKWEER
jgi:hypothetical protein